MKTVKERRRNGCAAVVWTWVAILTVISLLTVSASARPASARFPSVVPARGRSADVSAFEPDKGRFRIMVNGQKVGEEEFEVTSDGANWTIHGSTDIQSEKGTSHVTGTLLLQPDGTPIRYQWSTQGAKKASAKIDFSGSTATSQLRVGAARPFTQQFTFSSPRIAVLDNNLYDQYDVLARLYDWNKKGVQTFPVLVPQELTPGSATVESLGKRDADDGKKLEELRVTTEDNEIDLYLDGSRLIRINVPSANAEIIRE
jgi:hypothetical protein